MKPLPSLIFKYTGHDKLHNSVVGEIKAKHGVLAKAELESQGIRVRTITRVWFTRAIILADKLLLLLTQQLALLLKSGIPLASALELMLMQKNPRLQAVIVGLRARITQGSSLSLALQASGYFKPYYYAMIQAGEQSGQLEKVLSALALEQEQLLIFKTKIKKALAYPLCIVSVALAITLLLLVFVVPQFKILFSSNMTSLPTITRWLFVGSDWLTNLGATHFTIFIGFVLSIGFFCHTTSGWKKPLYAIFLKLPLLGTLFKLVHVIRYLRTLHLACMSNLPILQALALAEQISQIMTLSSAPCDIVSVVSQGKSVHLALTECQLFSPWIIHLIGLGEKSGQLPDMLAHCVNLVERDIDHITYQLTTFIEPLLMILLGIVLGTLIVALYLPIFQMGALY